ncbi:MAG TPA: energy transducer TonB [Xanthobacteraceae bacterium]|nr:energy transducer TonB [Xanthobacteraceae bacterium]
MAARAITWFEEEDPRELRRWALAATVVLGVHLAAIAGYLYVHQADEIGDESDVVSVELAPVDDTVDQPEVMPVPEQQPKPIETPPPPDTSQAVIAPAEEKPLPQTEQPRPPTPAMPARTKGGAPRVEVSWETGVVKHLQQYKRYPSGAQERGEEGVVLLSFSVDRTGHVLTRRVLHSSGYPELDDEVMAMIERAQPLPPFPPSMPEAKLDLTVPIRFSLR